MHQVFIVPAKMSPKGRMKKKAVPTGKKVKKFFGLVEVNETKVVDEFVPNGQSDCQVDSVALANDLEVKLQELAANGYAIINITPVISGSYAYKAEWSGKFSAGYGYGYGFSYTDGIMIVAFKQVTHAAPTSVSS
ncbi:hypothetical protein [Alteromonas macleodii]|uniref:Uncharacterized protein n=1 Tax=Alteromonas macleodii TaxID=28108 RepID=A0AB36FRK5_ALTMA|nr:hypothetical protein [Alteromonas macleodii]OES24228.1 hypothetical protein BFV93_4828 [Alteromonas macleodii]OES24859.1 hypothetical protein BFV95_4618 [Alteromonas macleodii]OES25137.1 hypothetical protein BFV94_4608 [Alteromonas macleodii]OES39179.1 hypothetical protein BFV96_4327 [Alteromonas macleodii]